MVNDALLELLAAGGLTVAGPSQPTYRGLPVVARVVVVADSPDFGLVVALADALAPDTERQAA